MFAPESIPYTFDGRYQRCYCLPQIAVDPRHVYTLFEVLNLGIVRHAVEIGCAFGASSTAFVEAMNRNTGLKSSFIEPTLQQSFLDVLNGSRNGTFQVYEEPSVSVLQRIEPFDFIFVDGLHDLLSVYKEIHLIEQVREKLLIIAAHDTSASAHGYELAEGAEWLKRQVMLDWGWHCIEDAVKRDGEETHRGLFMGTPSRGVHRLLLQCFRKWCADPDPVTKLVEAA